MSVLFEILEISAQDVMVNFQECWWDHAGLDLCGANAAGIYVGMRAVEYLELQVRVIPHLMRVLLPIDATLREPFVCDRVCRVLTS